MRKISLHMTILIGIWIICSGIIMNSIINDHSGVKNPPPRIAELNHTPIVIENDYELDLFCAGNGTSGTKENPHVIQNMQIDANGIGSAINIQNTTKYLIISNCNLNGSASSECGIKLLNSRNIIVSNNSIWKNSWGVKGENLFNCTINENLIYNNTRDGIYLMGCLNISLDSNIIENHTATSGNAMCIRYCSYLFVQNNYINRFQDSGIYIEACESSLFKTNLILRGNHGLSTSGSTMNNRFIGNNVSRNSQGFYCTGTGFSSNTLYFNIFAYNTGKQIESLYSRQNLWNNGTHGNYWGDYQQKYPFAQNINGVWDLEYFINGYEMDRFPLVNPPLQAWLTNEFVESSEIFINHPADVSFSSGLTGQYLSWTITGLGTSNNSCSIYRNGSLFAFGSWTSNSPVGVYIDGIDAGTYNFTIIADNGVGGSVQDVVWVRIISISNSSSSATNTNSSGTSISTSSSTESITEDADRIDGYNWLGIVLLGGFGIIFLARKRKCSLI